MVAAASPLVEDIHEVPSVDPIEADPPNPIAAFGRAMRGRWRMVLLGMSVLGPVFAAFGFMSGVKLYESQAILRVFPQESNILYATGEASVLKTFSSFVKAETSYVASHTVMERSVDALQVSRPDIASQLTAKDLAGSVEIKRRDSLIVMKTMSRDRAFAKEKLDAIIASYLGLKSDAEERRSGVRLSKLYAREAELAARLEKLRADQLEVGGEYGFAALGKAHIEKIAQIDGLAARKSEVTATLAAYEAESEASSADTSDKQIMRATLLDRAMADLNFERAKLMSQLAGLRSGFTEQTNLRFRQKEYAKIEEIAVIEQAMADRREQIRILGQTGALTSVTEGGDDTTVDEIRSLLKKVSGQLDIARKEARDLNRRRIDLDRIENEIQEDEHLLEETRRALEVIRLESGRALPGYAVVMSPPSSAIDPSEDSTKMMAAAGLGGGGFLAFVIVLFFALSERRVRFAETCVPIQTRMPVQQVSDCGDDDPHAADLLRNELQLQNLRKPRLVGKGPVIAVTRVSGGETTKFAKSLAKSFARSRMKTLYIDADIAAPPTKGSGPGWREMLSRKAVEPSRSTEQVLLWEMSAGECSRIEDSMVSSPMVNLAIDRLANCFDVVIVSAGCLQDRLSAKFVLSNADVGVLAITPDDQKKDVFASVEPMDALPRHGGVIALRNALRSDPWLAVTTRMQKAPSANQA